MAWITDSLRSAIRRLGTSPGPYAPDSAPLPGGFTHQLALSAYMASGLLRKVVAIPADDRVRAWREWQADAARIAAIEAEERRLDLRRKLREAEILRGLGGGALVLVTAGDHAGELDPASLGPGGLVAINVVSRWELAGKDWITDLADPLWRTPRMFKIGGDNGPRDIHPSRVIAFRGDPLPGGGAVSAEDAFWGDCRLLRVWREVERSDRTQQWFAALVAKAKLLRIGIPGLSDLVATDEGQARLNSRIRLIAEGESALNAVVYDAGASKDDPGEAITDYQLSWAGIPAVGDMFDQHVAAVADIPFTRLFGRSPAGLNATGAHDTDNWNRMVAAGQNLETRPCLEQLDPFLLRSAGVAADADVTWRFAPLDTPSEQQQAETFKTTMEAADLLRDTGAIPPEVFAAALRNLLAERQWLPGLEQALGDGRSVRQSPPR